MKGLAVLGSTGSIGTQTLSLVRDFPENFHVVSFAAGRNAALLRTQIAEFKPRYVFMDDTSSMADLAREFAEVHFVSGAEGINQTIDAPGVDIVVLGIVGFAALAPALYSVKKGKAIALANKESLIVAGNLFMEEVRKHGTRCIPVDSEHNALFQLLEGRPRDSVATVVITASGGPLLRVPDLPLEDVTPELATRHPNWKMGPKISVDSATLMNKGLEVAEAHYLFGYPSQSIEVWIHPQSILHGALWLTDNTCLAQLTKPDMRSAIGYAIGYPKRLPQVIPKLGLREMRNLEFYEPDNARFPALGLARSALESGPSHLITLNAANEIAVSLFLQGRLLFPRIAALVEKTLAKHSSTAVDNLQAVYDLDAEARRTALAVAASLS